jgi:hypothetical protein
MNGSSMSDEEYYTLPEVVAVEPDIVVRLPQVGDMPKLREQPS